MEKTEWKMYSGEEPKFSLGNKFEMFLKHPKVHVNQAAVGHVGVEFRGLKAIKWD